jgi:hypothetical protein
MTRLAASALCLLALAVVPAVALGQSAGDEQYGDPFAGEEPAQKAPDSSQNNGNQVVGQTEDGSDTGSPAPSATPAAQTEEPGASSGTGSNLAYTGYPAGLVALLGAFALTAGLIIRATAGRPRAPRRDAVLVLGRDLRLEPRARRR